jgi:predicted peptidase
MVEYYEFAGDRVFFAGNPASEPPGIWQYDIPSKTVSQIATGLKHKLIHTAFSLPECYMDTNATGKQLNYHVWRPVNNSKVQKHPLIIGQTHYMWFFYPQIAANAGYYFATADRASWWAGMNDWQPDVTRLYEILRINPEIDTNRVFLFATSAESAHLGQLMKERPDLWRGAILLNPGSLPPLSSSHLSAMFIVGGEDDADGAPAASLIKYQQDAAKAGITVRLILQDGVQHISRSIATERKRAGQFAQFLHEN